MGARSSAGRRRRLRSSRLRARARRLGWRSALRCRRRLQRRLVPTRSARSFRSFVSGQPPLLRNHQRQQHARRSRRRQQLLHHRRRQQTGQRHQRDLRQSARERRRHRHFRHDLRLRSKRLAQRCPRRSARIVSKRVVAGAPAIAPTRQTFIGAGRPAAVRPPATIATRTVVAKAPPPPAPVSVDRQEAAIKANAGRPIAATQYRQLRRSQRRPQQALPPARRETMCASLPSPAPSRRLNPSPPTPPVAPVNPDSTTTPRAPVSLR